MKAFCAFALAAMLSWKISEAVVSYELGNESDPLLTGKWLPATKAQTMSAFHSCFVMVGRKAVLLGGRKLEQPQIFDPVNRTWTAGKSTPGNVKLHHSQCVVVDEKIWYVAAWTGDFPHEKQAEYIYVYDPNFDTWETKAPMPDPRRRGSAATVAIGHRIYVAFGNRGGHEMKDFAESFPYLDVYNTKTGKWKALPNATYPRDHAGGALMADGRICVGGGRDGGSVGWPGIPQTECYNPSSKEWTIEVDVPEMKGAAAYASSCDGRLLMAGGDVTTGILVTTKTRGVRVHGKIREQSKTFHVFDGEDWTQLDDLQDSRDPGHPIGLAVDCVCNAIYFLSRTTHSDFFVETFFPGGVAKSCYT